MVIVIAIRYLNFKISLSKNTEFNHQIVFRKEKNEKLLIRGHTCQARVGHRDFVDCVRTYVRRKIDETCFPYHFHHSESENSISRSL